MRFSALITSLSSTIYSQIICSDILLPNFDKENRFSVRIVQNEDNSFTLFRKKFPMSEIIPSIDFTNCNTEKTLEQNIEDYIKGLSTDLYTNIKTFHNNEELCKYYKDQILSLKDKTQAILDKDPENVESLNQDLKNIIFDLLMIDYLMRFSKKSNLIIDLDEGDLKTNFIGEHDLKKNNYTYSKLNEDNKTLLFYCVRILNDNLSTFCFRKEIYKIVKEFGDKLKSKIMKIMDFII